MRAALDWCPRVTGSQDKAGRHGRSGLLRMPERPALEVFYFPEDRGKCLRTRLWLPCGQHAPKRTYVVWFTQGRGGGEDPGRGAQGDPGKRGREASPHCIQPVSPISSPISPGSRASCLLFPSKDPPSSFPYNEDWRSLSDCVLSHHLKESSSCLSPCSFHPLHSPVKVRILSGGSSHTYNISSREGHTSQMLSFCILKIRFTLF